MPGEFTHSDLTEGQHQVLKAMTTKPLRMGTIIPYADRRATPLTWEATEGALRRRIAELEAQATQLSVGKELAERALAVKDSLLDALRARVKELEQGHVVVNVELEAANGRVAELEAAIRQAMELLDQSAGLKAFDVLTRAVDA